MERPRSGSLPELRRAAHDGTPPIWSTRVEREPSRGMRIGILNALFHQEAEYCWAREPSSIRSAAWDGALSGPSSARGAMFRGVLASRASEGQGGLSAQGLNRMGSGSDGDQASSKRSTALAAVRGGARGGKPRWVSNRVRCQAILGFQGKLDLSIAFMMLRSLRMQATITTFAGFPAAFRGSAKARRTGLHRIAARVNMYSTQRPSARPPQMTRLPPLFAAVVGQGSKARDVRTLRARNRVPARLAPSVASPRMGSVSGH